MARAALGCFRFTKLYLGWKTHTYYYETDELPNRRPTQPKKNKRLKVAFGPLFSHSKYFFVCRDLVYIGKTLHETQRNQIIRKHPTSYLAKGVFYVIISVPPRRKTSRFFPCNHSISLSSLKANYRINASNTTKT